MITWMIFADSKRKRYHRKMNSILNYLIKMLVTLIINMPRLYGKLFKCTTMRDFHDLYLKTDVLKLADIFETFRKMCIEYHYLDPVHSFSTPGLSWDAMLNITKTSFELITDIDMYLMGESGLRGGVKYVADRISKHNNKYLGDYDKKESSYIMYLDANNLYSYAMGQPLTTGAFKWLKRDKCNKIFKKKQDIGYFFECDLKYPKIVINFHNDYPLASEKNSCTR